MMSLCVMVKSERQEKEAKKDETYRYCSHWRTTRLSMTTMTDLPCNKQWPSCRLNVSMVEKRTR
jgi:hypothetical protein